MIDLETKVNLINLWRERAEIRKKIRMWLDRFLLAMRSKAMSEYGKIQDDGLSTGANRKEKTDREIVDIAKREQNYTQPNALVVGPAECEFRRRFDIDKVSSMLDEIEQLKAERDALKEKSTETLRRITLGLKKLTEKCWEAMGTETAVVDLQVARNILLGLRGCLKQPQEQGDE